MGKKKGKTVLSTDFFGMHFQPAPNDAGYSSDDEREENRAWAAERDRQKTASKEAAARNQQREQAVALLEESDRRTSLTAIEKATRARLEDAIAETLIEREWVEWVTARRKEEHKQIAQFSTQQMLHRANIADKETENRCSFFNSFAASMSSAQEKARAEKDAKLKADREKAAERARMYEERMRKASVEKKPGLFELVDDVPTAEPKAPEAGGWFGWLKR